MPSIILTFNYSFRLYRALEEKKFIKNYLKRWLDEGNTKTSRFPARVALLTITIGDLCVPTEVGTYFTDVETSYSPQR